MFDFGIEYVTVCEATAHLPRAGYILFRDRSLAYYFGTRINWIRKGGTRMFDFDIGEYRWGYIVDPAEPEGRIPIYIIKWRDGTRSIFIKARGEWGEWRGVER